MWGGRRNGTSFFMCMIHFVKVSLKIVKASLSCMNSATCYVEHIHTKLSFTIVFLCIYTKVSLCDKKSVKTKVRKKELFCIYTKDACFGRICIWFFDV